MINGFDPAAVPGMSQEALQRMETDQPKEAEAAAAENLTVDSTLVKYVRDGLAKHECYLDLVGQVGSTPLEFFEDFVRQEKDLLKHHKSNFKQLVKHNSIRMGSDVTFAQFETVLQTHEWYS